MSAAPEIEVRNDTRYRVDVAAVAALTREVLRAEGVTAAELGVGFVGESRMRSLNRDHLASDYVTDVLAFPLEGPGEGRERREDGESVPAASEGVESVSGGSGDVPRLLGDVVVCLKRAERQASLAGLPLGLETATLLVHGILHVLGYDHETDDGRMARRQEEIAAALDWEGLVAPPAA